MKSSRKGVKERQRGTDVNVNVKGDEMIQVRVETCLNLTAAEESG
jgi:hypothetical protein